MGERENTFSSRKRNINKCQSDNSSNSVVFRSFLSLNAETFTPQPPQPHHWPHSVHNDLPSKQCISFSNHLFIGGQYSMGIRNFYPPSLRAKSSKERKWWKSLSICSATCPSFLKGNVVTTVCTYVVFVFTMLVMPLSNQKPSLHQFVHKVGFLKNPVETKELRSTRYWQLNFSSLGVPFFYDCISIFARYFVVVATDWNDPTTPRQFHFP